MSAITIIRQRNAVHVLADGGFYVREVYRGISIKAWPLPHLSAVVAFRGTMGIPPILASTLSQLPTFADLKANIVAMLRDATAAAAPYLGGTPPTIHCLVGGIGPDGPDSYAVATPDVPGMPAWEMVELGPFAAAPGDEQIQAEIWKALPNVYGPDDIDPVRDGRAILEAQRRCRISLPGETGTAHLVGGFGQLCTVTADEITTKIIVRWPDVIGHPITP